jgi:hypothetical protein
LVVIFRRSYSLNITKCVTEIECVVQLLSIILKRNTYAKPVLPSDFLNKNSILLFVECFSTLSS